MSVLSSVRLMIPVPELENLVIPEIEEFFQTAVLDVSITERLVPAASVPLEHCFVLWRQRRIKLLRRKEPESRQVGKPRCHCDTHCTRRPAISKRGTDTRRQPILINT